MRTFTFAGDVEITNLPPHFGLIASIAFFSVSGREVSAPYDGDPPGDAVEDSAQIFEQVDLETEVRMSARTVPFSIERPAGYYYLQLRAVLFRKQDNEFQAQVEPFFFARRPLALLEDLKSVTLAVEWPSIAIEDLEYYGTFRPDRPPSRER
jgi:hypothetical protein